MDSGTIIAIANGLNGLLSVINKITVAFGSLGSIDLSKLHDVEGQNQTKPAKQTALQSKF